MSPRAAAGRRSAFDRSAYERDLEAYLAEREDELYQHGAGLRDELALAPIYARHAALFSRDAVDPLRALVEAGGDELGRNRALLAVATDGFSDGRIAALSDAIGTAEAKAIVVWRGERIPYRALRNRISDISGRAERNALFASYLEAVEALNPLRRERVDQIDALARELGYADYVELIKVTRGFDPDALGAEIRDFLADSETPYFAALRRYLARIEVEQGDASLADLWYLMRGSGWDNWFDGRRIIAVLEATLRGLGIELRGQPGATLDVDARPNKSPRAFVAVVNAPRDVRLVIQPHGGWDDYGAILHEAGHLEHFLHVDPSLPVGSRELGDAAVTEGYAMTFERLLAEPDWLVEQLGMPAEHADAFADFYSLYHLVTLRSLAASHLHQLRLHRGGNAELHRATYAGLAGLLVGVREPPERYLAIDDGMYAASYLRCFMLDAALTDYLTTRHGSAWWRSTAAGETLKRAWSRGQSWTAEQVVAHLGYDSLDWRPVVRQIRAKLVGEMSGYGGPNITTRAGTRKV
jgi:nitroreductase